MSKKDVPSGAEHESASLSNEHLALLVDHFKDSFQHQVKYIQLRDRLFNYILITVTILLFQAYSPVDAERAITDAISKQLGTTGKIDISFLGSVTWFVLLGLAHRYYQAVILVENQYRYLHKLEDQIGPVFGDKAFRREGREYLSNYPRFSNWSHILYQWIFPPLLVLIATLKIVDEWQTLPSPTLTLWFNTAFYIMLLISTVLYLLRIHFKK